MSNLVYAELELPLLEIDEEEAKEKEAPSLLVLEISPENENVIQI